MKLLHGHPNIIKLLSSFQQKTSVTGNLAYHGKRDVKDSKATGGNGAHVFMVFELMQQTLLDVL